MIRTKKDETFWNRLDRLENHPEIQKMRRYPQHQVTNSYCHPSGSCLSMVLSGNVGQAAGVIETAKMPEQKTDISIEELAEAAKSISGKVQMCFVPETLGDRKAGGRVSNAGARIGNLLRIHPCIRIENGKLPSREKYRGGMKKIVVKVIRTHAQKYHLKKEKLYLLRPPGLSEDIKEIAEQEAKSCGFQKINWMQTGCVITSHGGRGCFGVVGMEI